MRRALRASVFALLVISSSAFASDGVLEINQTCATATGCFGGDVAGFPVTITASAGERSFRLTSNLAVASATETAVDISTNGVTLDLGGFRIKGPTTCSGVPITSCAPLGAGVGVLGASDVVVRNGTITGMGDDGVRVSYSSRVEALNVFQNGGDGVATNNQSVISGNVITSNGDNGIRCANFCVITGNTSTGNKFDGIETLSGTVTSNTANQNGGRGLEIGPLTSFGNNMQSLNVVGDVNGGHAAAGNVCGDATCSSHGARRFYLTLSTHNGAQALTACALGFHMASLWEIWDPSGLSYDWRQGQTTQDSGQGPPGETYGWIRVGGTGNGSGFAGQVNCVDWTSASGTAEGTVAALPDGWGYDLSYGIRVMPWDPRYLTGTNGGCANLRPVWCVED